MKFTFEMDDLKKIILSLNTAKLIDFHKLNSEAVESKDIQSLLIDKYIDDYFERSQRYPQPDINSPSHREHMVAIEKLFLAGILKASSFQVKDLFWYINYHCGWESNDQLFKLLLRFIPKEQWISLLDEETGRNILHELAYSSLRFHQKDEYLLFFINAGADIHKVDNWGATLLLPLMKYASGLIPKLLQAGMNPNELVKHAERKVSAETPRFCGKELIRSLYRVDYSSNIEDDIHLNCYFSLLHSFRFAKNVDWLAEVKSLFQLLILHGCDPSRTFASVQYHDKHESSDGTQSVHSAHKVVSYQSDDNTPCIDYATIHDDEKSRLGLWDFIRGYGYEEYFGDLDLPWKQYLTIFPSGLNMIISNYVSGIYGVESYKRPPRAIYVEDSWRLNSLTSRISHFKMNTNQKKLIYELERFKWIKTEASISDIIAKYTPRIYEINTSTEVGDHRFTDCIANNFYELFDFRYLFNWDIGRKSTWTIQEQ